jgi:hypothetical protein
VRRGWWSRWWPASPADAASSANGAADAAAVPSALAVIDRLRQRLGRAPAPALPGIEPAWGPSAAPRASAAAAAVPVRRAPQRWLSSAQWLALFGRVAAMLAVLSVMVSSWQLMTVAQATAEHTLTLPTLSNYPALARVRLAGKPAQGAPLDVGRLLAPQDDHLLQAVQNIATFENLRAEPALRAAAALVQAVAEGSKAQAAGVRAGDLVQRVNGAQAGFVWDVYKAITERPVRELVLELRRGEDTLAVTVRTDSDDGFDMTNHGLLFNVPAQARYIGQTDVARLTEQLRISFVDSQPSELRRTYEDGLLAMTLQLVANLTLLSAPEGAPAGFHTEDLLGWYHGRFAEAVSRWRVDGERLRAREIEALSGLAWALMVGGGLALVALALGLRRRWLP